MRVCIDALHNNNQTMAKKQTKDIIVCCFLISGMDSAAERGISIPFNRKIE